MTGLSSDLAGKKVTIDKVALAIVRVGGCDMPRTGQQILYYPAHGRLRNSRRSCYEIRSAANSSVDRHWHRNLVLPSTIEAIDELANE